MPDQRRRAAARGGGAVLFGCFCSGVSRDVVDVWNAGTGGDVCGDNREAVTQRRRFTLPSHNRTSQGFTRAELDVYWAMQSTGNNSRVNAVTGGEQG